MSSGWLEPAEGLAARVAELVEAGRVPAGIDMQVLRLAGALYEQETRETGAHMPLSDAAEAIEVLTREVETLRAKLDSLPGPVRAIVAASAARVEGNLPLALKAATESLGRLHGLLAIAEHEIEDRAASGAFSKSGRKSAPLYRLVWRIADAAERAGGTADASKNGPVRLLAGLFVTTKTEDDDARLMRDIKKALGQRRTGA